jgi:rSAM/selenodomain-associated transferase 1
LGIIFPKASSFREDILIGSMVVTASTQRLNFTNALLIMAKHPKPGKAKTRLVPPLSPDQAAALYDCFLRDTLDLVRQVPHVQPVVAYSPGGAGDYFASLAPDLEHIPQKGPDLGARLDNALTHYLNLGYQHVVAMNSDGPSLPLAHLTLAFEKLSGDYDVVLGPSDDGGYYLIGLKRPAPRLLREVRMSTSHVTIDTLTVAVEERLRVALLPQWYDVDDATSLPRLAAELAEAPLDVAPHTRAFLERDRELWRRLRGFQPHGY